MSLIYDHTILGSRIILWDLNESDIEIASFINLEVDLNSLVFKNRGSRMSLGWQFVLKKVLNDAYYGVYKDENGKPFLISSSYQFSISHTHNLIIIALHQCKKIGIDIEQVSAKVDRVKYKFLCSDEINSATTLDQLTEYWCIKEAAYKLNGKKNISFKNEILIKPNAVDSGSVCIRNEYVVNYKTIKYNDYIICLATEM